MSDTVAQLIPSYLTTPPNSTVRLPVVSRSQELPLAELGWEDFEKLCLRLVRLDASVEECRLYGKRGQLQSGIDIYARLKEPGSYTVYQCKRVKKFGSAQVKAAVNAFLKEKWADKAKKFVLCTSENLGAEVSDEIELQASRLKKKGITLLPWDCSEISSQLKDQPQIVDDFFGRHWVEDYCGKDAVSLLSNRLTAEQVRELRKTLAGFYRQVFTRHDPGISIYTQDETAVLPLDERFILPDILQNKLIQYSSTPDIALQDALEDYDEVDSHIHARQQRRQSPSRQSGEFQQRQSVDQWLTSNTQSVVLGGPGSGKSTLLRYIALDMLSEQPFIVSLSQEWGSCIPIWIPFALWTNRIVEGPDCSLSELMHGWLEKWDELRLWPLVEQALNDDRLLLLIDGIDEWTNEASAKIAWDRLAVYVAQRNTPVVLTGRPSGFSRIGPAPMGWQVGSLAGFSPEQQEKLARIWFTHKAKAIDKVATDEDSLVRRISHDTQSFVSELGRSTDIRDLARVPLLLTLLIGHKFGGAVLPRNRFQAYESLIEHLIRIHPKKRQQAAWIVGDAQPLLSEDDIKRVLAYLAYYIHSQTPEGEIDQSAAFMSVSEYLQNPSGYFALEPREADNLAKELVSVGKDSIGILVEKSPSTVGFFHRVFQEYLTAHYLSHLSLESQISAITGHGVDPQWQESILGLMYLTRRGDDTAKLIDALRTTAKKCCVVDSMTSQLTLYEVAFGDFSNCPASVAKDLAKQAFDDVAFSDWMPYREQVLSRVIDGLRSKRMGDQVKSTLSTWFPCHTWYRVAIFYAFKSWAATPELRECLVRGLYDEDSDVQRSAADVIAKLYKGDQVVGDRIVQIASHAVDPKVRAAACKAALAGWPEHPSLEKVIEAAGSSLSQELRLVGIMGRVSFGRQSDADLQDLVAVGSIASGCDYYWKEDVADVLVRGWPHSDKLKHICLESLGRFGIHSSKFNESFAAKVLLTGYPGNNDVVDLCISEIMDSSYPFLSVEDAWLLLSKNFANHPKLVPAIDDWLPTQEDRQRDVAYAALVGRTPLAKAKLISDLHSAIPAWSARALLDGWGMHDEEVANAFMGLAYESTESAGRIAYLLPKIITDSEKCKQRLLELLKDDECSHPDYVLHGLRELCTNGTDVSVLELALRRLEQIKCDEDKEDLIHEIIISFPNDPRVRKIALEQISAGNWCIGSIARIYANDDDMRDRIQRIANPLPASLRSAVATGLKENCDDTGFALSLLKLYRLDPDADVQTMSSICYYQRLVELDLDTKDEVDLLSQDIMCSGFRSNRVRQAAFCGLSIIHRLDVMISADERTGTKGQCSSISIREGITYNYALIKHILENWTYISDVLGDELASRLSNNKFEENDLLNQLSILAQDYPHPREQVLAYIEKVAPKITSRNLLRFLACTRPQSHLLLQCCLHMMNSEDSEDSRDYWSGGMMDDVAGEILGSHFGGNDDVLSQILPKDIKSGFKDSLVVALCIGWPNCESLDQILTICRESKRKMSWLAYFSLVSIKSSSEGVYDAIQDALSEKRGYGNYLSEIIRLITRRVHYDDDLYSLLITSLNERASSSQKASIPRLLGSARGLDAAMKNWCVEEVQRQMSDDYYPEIGYDIVSGQLRPVLHSLLDVLSTSTSSGYVVEL